MIFILINVLGLLLIALLIWWFWLSTPSTIKVDNQTIIDIIVKDGTYQPAYIEARVGKPLVLRFTREDASPCAEVVVFSALNINQQLPLRQATEIPLNVEKAGTYEFTCQMGMYRGKLIVNE